MRAVEAVIKVSHDGSVIVNIEKNLKPGLHKILIITDETTIPDNDQQGIKKKQLLDLKMIHTQGWPENSTFRREEIYDDDGR